METRRVDDSEDEEQQLFGDLVLEGDGYPEGFFQ